MRHQYSYYVYIITNSGQTTFYIGVTNDIHRRMFEHKSGKVAGFSKRYHLKYLVYVEETDEIDGAIAREKQLKNWHRKWKLDLIRSQNPNMEDLSEKWTA